jgi:hypothetical protein
MKYIFICLFLLVELFGAGIKAPIVAVEEQRVTVEIDKIDVGVSGFIIHELAEDRHSILKNAVVESFDAQTKRATLKVSDFDSLTNNALPKGKWEVKVGDVAVLPYAYNRGFLVAPTEEIYYRVTRSVETLEWIHPDIFATILSFNGHPTPIKSDFEDLSKTLSIGLVFIYLDQLLYTVDIKSMKILNISDAPLEQVASDVVLPFYTRVENIDAAWWGEGSGRLKEFAPHYYELLVKHNKENKELYEKIKNSDKKLHFLLEKFEIKG